MTKYYRVRTQEQWEWLKNKLEIKGDLHVSYFPVTILDGDVFCGIYKYHDDPEPLIEVSQMMEESKMEDYVEIKRENLADVEFIDDGCHLGEHNRIKDIQKIRFPKSLLYPKVRMSVAEKKEFDELKRHRGTVYGALDMIEDDYPKLYTRLFGNSSHEGDSKAQLEFARAWADELLIETIPDKKWNVKVPVADGPTFYFKTGDGVDVCKPSPTMQNLETTRFTAEEIKQYGLDNDLFEKIEVGK